ncbi:MAG: hypothetical protein RSE41_09755 [Clostridia bacterium]
MKNYLTNQQKTDIANQYAFEANVVSMQVLAKKFNVSTTTISKSIHYCIEKDLVNDLTCEAIQIKAIAHAKVRMLEKNILTNNITLSYEKSFKLRLKNKNKNKRISKLTKNCGMLQFCILNYDENFFKEYNLSLEELRENLDLFESKLKDMST